jgi:hypothetical protein
MLIKDLPVTSDVDILDPLASTLSSARASGKNNRIQHPKNQQHDWACLQESGKSKWTEPIAHFETSQKWIWT